MLLLVTLIGLIHKLFKQRLATPAAIAAATEVIEGELVDGDAVDSAATQLDTSPPTRQPRYSIGLVGFHEQGFIIARPTSPYAPWLRERASTLHRRLGGMSNITDGLRQAFELLARLPHGVRRTVWLLSSGSANRELRSLFSVVNICREARIAIHSVGLGSHCDSALLHEISAASHHGSYHRVDSAHDLSDLLTAPYRGGEPRAEAIVVVVDCGHTMAHRLRQRSKIGAVEEALLDLIYQQKQRSH